jgi:protein-tyrosine-phosphatase/N-acetylglutamate synthase-like GNAT family acetyltransferase
MLIESAATDDEAAIKSLLAAADLPTADWSPELLQASVVARKGERVVGVGAIERRGQSGLLRSVAVAAELRGTGMGRDIVTALEQRARRDGLSALYLLTTTASGFFERLGYRALSREDAPVAIRMTAQFGSLYPASSVFMRKPMADKIFNVLFLCTGNSARSILAEAILNHASNRDGTFRGFSAGSHPRDCPNPYALDLLQESGIPVADLRSKSWDEFSRADAPELDFVFTVCDKAAGEQCPLWPGQPMTAHWGMPDPAEAEGSEEQKRKAFTETFMALRRRIDLFTSLPIRSLDSLALQRRLQEIGKE